MKNKIALLFFLLFLLNINVVYCRKYVEKYKDVLEYYQQADCDSLKYRAAYFLITNMDGHYSPYGTGVDSFVVKIRRSVPKSNIGILSGLWRESNKNRLDTRMTEDSCIVTSQQLKVNIDDAFKVWRGAPWKKDVPFENFLRYVLPYKIFDEYMSGENWRNQLRQEYSQYVNNEDDIKSAYVKLRQAVQNHVSNSVAYAPVNIDVLSYNHIRRANCQQRCILLASVLRAFGIPAAIDNVPYWADYSTMGHSWVALVMGNGDTYTVYGDEDEAKQFNKIDASEFKESESIHLLNDLRFSVKLSKSVAKIYRKEYGIVNRKLEFRQWFVDQFTLDVSGQYGLDGKIEFKRSKDNSKIENLYLCTFVSGKDWLVLSRGMTYNNRFVFDHVGKNVVYLPAYLEDNKLKPYCAPVLLDKDNKMSYLEGNNKMFDNISIKRKYPICSYIPIQWQKLIGGIFEASNDSLFKEADCLFRIESTPEGSTTVNLGNDKSYRYVRFRSPDKEIALISELSFYTKEKNNDQKLSGRAIYSDVDKNKIGYVFDEDIETKPKAFKAGYWIGLDLGRQRNISRIEFTPISDGNDIQKGHLYELLCYDQGWKLIGRQFADKNSPLVFRNLPQNMLYLLKDKTKGIEERIFILKDNKQIWY